jgi:hypothetical protein
VATPSSRLTQNAPKQPGELPGKFGRTPYEQSSPDAWAWAMILRKAARLA